MLQQLLSALTDAERSSLDRVILPERLANILSYFRTNPAVSPRQYCTESGITLDYYKKAEAQVIQSLCSHLGCDDHRAKLQFLFERKLYPLYRSFSQKFEKQLLQEGRSKNELFEFYQMCSKHLLYFEKPEYSVFARIEEYAKKIAACPHKKYPDEHHAIEAALLSLRLIHINSNKRLTLLKKRLEAERLLKQWQYKYYRTKSIRAKFYFLLARSRYYTHYKQKDVQAQIRIYEQASELITSKPSLFDEIEMTTFKLRHARYYLINNYREECYALYSEIYRDDHSNWARYGMAHYFGYLRAMLQVNKAVDALSEAQRIHPEVKRAGSRLLELGHALVMTEAYIHLGQFTEAQSILQKVKKLMRGDTYYHTYDVSIRIAETTTAYFLGKWDEAIALADRHIRWFKENDPNVWEEAVTFMRFIQAVIHYKITGKIMVRKYRMLLNGDYTSLQSFPPHMLKMIISFRPKNL